MNSESVIESDMTFYVRLEKEINIGPSELEEENLKTSDDIVGNIFMEIVSLIYLKRTFSETIK